jgi:hypothetical protein
MCQAGQVWAQTGHALAVLGARDGEPSTVADARRRLTEAVDAFDPDTHHRAWALCTTRLAMLALAAGDLDQCVRWTGQALRSAGSVRSARLLRDLVTIRAAAAERDDPAVRDLIASIDALTGDDE